jgi:outer membrane protein assembly factor BamB
VSTATRSQRVVGPSDDVPRCLECGVPIAGRFCGRCGANLDPTFRTAATDGSDLLGTSGSGARHETDAHTGGANTGDANTRIAARVPRCRRLPLPAIRVTALVVALLAAYLALELRPPPEVVGATAPLGPVDGTRVSSSHAVTDLSVPRWTHRRQAPLDIPSWPEAVQIDEDRLLVTAGSIVQLLDARSFVPRWEAYGERATYLADEDVVVVSLDDLSVQFTLDATTGRLLARTPLDGTAWESYPVGREVTVVVGPARVAAYRASTRVWELASDGADGTSHRLVHADPETTLVLRERGAVARAPNPQELLVIETSTGAIRATIRWDHPVSTVDVLDADLVVTGATGESLHVAGYDVETGRQLWVSSPASGSVGHWGTLVTDTGTFGVWWVDRDTGMPATEIVLLDPHSGAVRWRTSLPELDAGSVVAVAGGIVAADDMRVLRVQYGPGPEWTWSRFRHHARVTPIGDDLLVTTMGGQPLLLDGETGEARPGIPTPVERVHPGEDPVLSGLGLLLPPFVGQPRNLDPLTGEELEFPPVQLRVAEAATANPIALEDGGLLVADDRGIHRIRTDGSEIWTISDERADGRPQLLGRTQHHAFVLLPTAAAEGAAAGRVGSRPISSGVELRRVRLGDGSTAGSLHLGDVELSGFAAGDGLALLSLRALDPLVAMRWGPATDPEELVAVDGRSMTERWRVELGGRGPAVAIAPEGVLLGEPGRICLLDPGTGESIWTTDLPALTRPALAVADGRAVQVSASAVLAVDLEDGDVVWQRPIGGRLSTRPTIAGNVVYVGTDSGLVVGLRLQDGSRATLAVADPDGRPITSVTVAEGQAIVGTSDGGFRALGPRTPAP